MAVTESTKPLKVAEAESITLGEVVAAVAEVTGLPAPKLCRALAAVRLYAVDANSRVALLDIESITVDEFGELPPFTFLQTREGDEGPMVTVPPGMGAISEVVWDAYNGAVSKAFWQGVGRPGAPPRGWTT